VDDSYAQGFIDQKPNLRSVYELSPLNKVLRERQQPEVQGL
jgi:hypothetical protein